MSSAGSFFVRRAQFSWIECYWLQPTSLLLQNNSGERVCTVLHQDVYLQQQALLVELEQHVGCDLGKWLGDIQPERSAVHAAIIS